MDYWPAGVSRRVLTETDSTMAEAARRARDGAPGPEWTLALHQTQARGRRGRAWAMPPGNFAATLLMRPKGPPAAAALRSFIAALALREAVIGTGVPVDRVALKWPNDVMLDEGKLAGILLESLADGAGGIAYLLVGVGVNLAAAPAIDEVEQGAFAPVSLNAQTGAHIAPEAFLTDLAVSFDRFDRQFETLGFAPIRTAWLAAATRLGQRVTARTGHREVTGIFLDIDGDGNLVLDTVAGPETVTAGEVFF